MELRQLRYFVTVAQTLNFSEAARRLYITQGTLSQQIRQLEGEMGSPLFDRTSRSVELTEAGTELLPLAKKAIEASETCMDRMRNLQGALCGSLKIGATHSFSHLLAESTKTFTKEYPGVKLSIFFKTAGELLVMLRNKDIDVALAYLSVTKKEDVDSETLFKTRLCVVMRDDHPLADRTTLSLDDLKGQGVILPGHELQARRAFDNFVGIDTRSLNVRAELNDASFMTSLVKGTHLVAIATPPVTHNHPDLRVIPLENGHYEMVGCAHTLKDSHRKRSLEVFMEILRDTAFIHRLCSDMKK